MSPATGGSEVAQSDPQSPVIDGRSFTNYDTIFIHGAMAGVNPALPGVRYEGNSPDGYTLQLIPSTPSVYVTCPFVSYNSKQGGIQPRARYLGLEYMTSGAEIFRIDVYNGHSFIQTIDYNPPIGSTTYTVKVIDLGAWYRFDRGLGMCLFTRNPSSTYDGFINIGGYGARYE